MGNGRRVPGRVIQLLVEDPDLGEHMPPDARRQATEVVRARVFTVPKGIWEPPAIDHGATGLLLLEGLMVRTLEVGSVSSSEIVGPTDIIRPWENDLIPALVPALTKWRVLEAAQVALLDGRVTALLGRWPELSAAVSGRLLRRARSLAYLMAAQHFVRVEHRLLATLWHLAAMWGRVTPRGTLVPFRLTHEMLAGIIGAQRPTTTMAIRSLTEQGRLLRDDKRCYVLLGDPPDWSKEAAPVRSVEV
ncbi:MAG TPA: helix-turn-helix domain-containing protein [Solirubrobacteraceae bacterium]|nr:helix-turn-helix domain-containing protein [Solirubrobacteraceae bacterium]